MTYKDIYNDLKAGFSFNNGYSYVTIGTCNRWGSPSYGKDYIYYQHACSSALSVSYKNLCWLIRVIFKMNANEFYKLFTKEV